MSSGVDDSFCSVSLLRPFIPSHINSTTFIFICRMPCITVSDDYCDINIGGVSLSLSLVDLPINPGGL